MVSAAFSKPPFGFFGTPTASYFAGLTPELCHEKRIHILCTEHLGEELGRLGLASNRLRTLDGLGAVATLRELYADHNGIDAMGALSGLSRLHTLDLSCNRLAAVECATLTALEELWLNENPIESAADLADLARLTGLRTIYLAGSPIAQSPDYRAELCRLVPSLHQLDADAIAPRVGESSL